MSINSILKDNEFDIVDTNFEDGEIIVNDQEFNQDYKIIYDVEKDTGETVLEKCQIKRAEWFEKNSSLIYSGF